MDGAGDGNEGGLQLSDVLVTARDGLILCCSFCPAESTSYLLAYGTSTDKLCLTQFSVSSQDDDDEGLFRAESLRTLHHGVPCTKVAWSPASSLSYTTFDLFLCTAGGDHRLRFYSVSGSETVVKEAAAHTDAVNAVAFDDSGQLAASVGDDRIANVFDAETTEPLTTIQLDSAGINVVFAPGATTVANTTLLIGQRNGTIRRYKATSAQPLQTIVSPKAPLQDFDWKGLDIGGITTQQWYVWQNGASSIPVSQGSFGSDDTATIFRWSRTSPHVCALALLDKVHLLDVQHGTTLIQGIPGGATSLSWHATAPLCALAMGSALVVCSSE